MTSNLSRRSLLARLVSASGGLLLSRNARANRWVGTAEAVLQTPDGRAITVSEWRPAGHERGLILFSHGAGSSPRFYEALIGPWVRGGWRVLAPLHVDSAEHPDTAKFPGLASWRARIEDMRALSVHAGNREWVAAGHSYGALVALTMGGAAAVVPQGISGSLSEANARAVVAFSPPAPVPALVTEAGYSALRVPALIQTGTRDVPQMPAGMPPLPPESWTGHLKAFEAARPGNDRYALVLDQVDHYFGGAICRYDLPGPRQLARLADACRLSLQFLAGYGAGDRKARRLLDASLTESFPVKLQRK